MNNQRLIDISIRQSMKVNELSHPSHIDDHFSSMISLEYCIEDACAVLERYRAQGYNVLVVCNDVGVHEVFLDNLHGANTSLATTFAYIRSPTLLSSDHFDPRFFEKEYVALFYSGHNLFRGYLKNLKEEHYDLPKLPTASLVLGVAGLQMWGSTQYAPYIPIVNKTVRKPLHQQITV